MLRWGKNYAGSENNSSRVTRVTRMAYSPRLWLMAIGW
jgi:hypothetical protein